MSLLVEPTILENEDYAVIGVKGPNKEISESGIVNLENILRKTKHIMLQSEIAHDGKVKGKVSDGMIIKKWGRKKPSSYLPNRGDAELGEFLESYGTPRQTIGFYMVATSHALGNLCGGTLEAFNRLHGGYDGVRTARAFASYENTKEALSKENNGKFQKSFLKYMHTLARYEFWRPHLADQVKKGGHLTVCVRDHFAQEVLQMLGGEEFIRPTYVTFKRGLDPELKIAYEIIERRAAA